MTDTELPLTGGAATPRSRPYRPSNGSEGEWFMGRWCGQCQKEATYRKTDDGADACRIATNTMAFDIDDPLYPKEWVKDERGPRCTAFEEESRNP